MTRCSVKGYGLALILMLVELGSSGLPQSSTDAL